MENQKDKSLKVTQSAGFAFERLGIALAAWAERWFPDALVFALVAILVVFVAGLLLGGTVGDMVGDFGGGLRIACPSSKLHPRT